jgi:hypothetical protein
MASKGIMQAAKEVRKRKTSFVQFQENSELIDTAEIYEKLGNMEETERQEESLETFLIQIN